MIDEKRLMEFYFCVYFIIGEMISVYKIILCTVVELIEIHNNFSLFQKQSMEMLSKLMYGISLRWIQYNKTTVCCIGDGCTDWQFGIWNAVDLDQIA